MYRIKNWLFYFFNHVYFFVCITKIFKSINRKAQEINAKNFNYDEYQEDFLHDESLATGDFLKIMNKKKDLTNDNKKIEDEILNHVIMESLKHK